MKAIIMAGGYGSRLRPLTDVQPKPMVPIINKPIMQYIVQLLVSHNIKDIGMTLGYMPDKITQFFGDGSEYGANISYFIEEEPLGTAGSIKNASKFIDDDFIVISGDAFTNIDLSEFIEEHYRMGKIATIAVTHRDDVSEFGVVKYDTQNTIQCFIEKPKFSPFKMVNTGIYVFKKEILQRIPQGKYDFGKQLFPDLIGEMAVYETNAYWSDIGSLSSYYLTNNDAVIRHNEFGISL